MKKDKVILLVVFFLLLAAVIIFKFAKNSKEVLKPIFTADSTAVAKIEIADRDTSITFEKQQARWMITKPAKWNVKEDQFQLFLQEVIFRHYSPKPVASGGEALEEYRLTRENALRVKAFNSKGKLLKEVWFGDPGNPYDYFCFQGDSNIYQIRRKVLAFYRPQFDAWRSPHVVSVNWDELLAIKVRHEKGSYDLLRDGGVWHYKDQKEEFEIPPGNQTMGKILNSLANMSAHTMLAEDEAPAQNELGRAVCDIDLDLVDKSHIKISFHPWEQYYLMQTSLHPGSYFVMVADTLMRFTRDVTLFRAVEGDPSL
ncbi:MAG: DUF4340 domain-containing protein [Candidatus Cloacimonetes bacterium]|nr:DUF4340 domain-containing protein [Candidatus Cloacimonadota bacterium]